MSYTVSGINKWLHHHGFSYKKPKGVPHKLKPEEQQTFIEYYNEVLKPKVAPVLFMDAVHPTQSTKLSCGWIRKGQDKLIDTTGSRTRVNLIGALSLKNISATITDTYEKIDSESIVRFFWKLKKEHVRNNVYFPSKTAFTSAIKKFFDVTLPEVAGSLVSRITDNFQVLVPASSS